MTVPQYPPGYSAQQPPFPQPYPQQYAPQDLPKTGTSVASLVLGISAIVLPFLGIVTGIIAVILGVDGMNNYKAGRSNSSSNGMAVGGLCCGIAGAAIWLIVLIIAVSGGFATDYYYCDSYSCY